MNKDVIEIMERFAALDIASLELELDAFSLRLQKAVVLSESTAKAPSQEKASIFYDENETVEDVEETQAAAYCEPGNLFAVRSPLVGIFYSKPSPNAEVFVNIGDTVEKGDVLCVVEAMKNFNEIQSPVKGVVAAKHFEDDDMVQFDDVLFEIEESC